jgi:hypothetical protein
MSVMPRSGLFRKPETFGLMPCVRAGSFDAAAAVRENPRSYGSAGRGLEHTDPPIAPRINALSLLAFERTRHGVGVSGNDSEQHLCRLVGPMRALLPIAHSPEREMKPRREFFLRQFPFALTEGEEAEAANVPRVEKADLALPEPRRHRDRNHLKFVTLQPCLLCGRRPSDAHHIRFAQAAALGCRVSDEFTVPLCRLHHRALHRRGDEAAWWAEHQVDPLAIAENLWQSTRDGGNGIITAPAGRAVPTPVVAHEGRQPQAPTERTGR